MKKEEYKDVIHDWIGDFAIITRGNKKGIIYIDGTIVIEPIFDYVEHNNYHTILASYDNSKSNFDILLGTFGDGYVCIEERKRTQYGRTRIQYFVNKNMEKVLVFDEIWAMKNDIDIDEFHIPLHTTCHFYNGILKIDVAVDEYFGRLFEININGDVKYIGETHYKEFITESIENYLNYDGYEEFEYYNIENDSYRDALDDDIEAMGNLD